MDRWCDRSGGGAARERECLGVAIHLSVPTSPVVPVTHTPYQLRHTRSLGSRVGDPVGHSRSLTPTSPKGTCV